MYKLFLAAVSIAAIAAPAQADTILAGNLIADASEGAMGPATIVTDGDRIVSVTAGLQAPDPANEECRDHREGGVHDGARRGFARAA